MRAIVIRLLIVAAVVVAAYVVAVRAWEYSEVVLEVSLDPATVDQANRAVVVASSPEQVTLSLGREPTGAAVRDTTLGLDWSGGFNVIGEVLEVDGSTVTRTLLGSSDPPRQGASVRLVPATIDAPPDSALGIDYTEIEIDADLGTLPAWRVGGGTRWVIHIHDRGGGRRDVLRLLPTLTEEDLAVLSITYRNDPEVAPDPSGMYRYGVTEWRDLHAAVRYAEQLGAREIILMGDGMGAAIALEYMEKSGRTRRIAGLILDSPTLNVGGEVDEALERREVPRLFATLAKQVAALRYDVRWADVDHRKPAVDRPMLVFHGEAESAREIDDIDQLASATDAEVVATDGAGHLESWNVDPDTYAQRLQDWLRSVLADAS